jgi:bifunctional DNA-binding transcriptional regulator/antitoxin component of YhaV-PrlF toxin-antitoxin module
MHLAPSYVNVNTPATPLGSSGSKQNRQTLRWGNPGEIAAMARVKVRDYQLQLPKEAGDALGLAADDELEVEVVDNTVLLRRLGAERRIAGLERIRRARAGVRLPPELATLSSEECEARIAELIEADRTDSKPHA